MDLICLQNYYFVHFSIFIEYEGSQIFCTHGCIGLKSTMVLLHTSLNVFYLHELTVALLKVWNRMSIKKSRKNHANLQYNTKLQLIIRLQHNLNQGNRWTTDGTLAHPYIRHITPK